MYKKQLMKHALTVYDGAPKAEPVVPFFHRQSEELLAALKDDKAPPPLARDRWTDRDRGGPPPISSLRR